MNELSTIPPAPLSFLVLVLSSREWRARQWKSPISEHPGLERRHCLYLWQPPLLFLFFCTREWRQDSKSLRIHVGAFLLCTFLLLLLFLDFLCYFLERWHCLIDRGLESGCCPFCGSHSSSIPISLCDHNNANLGITKNMERVHPVEESKQAHDRVFGLWETHNKRWH